MANRYWITTSGSANFNDTANWSTTSGGSGGASVPGSSDVAIFDRTGTYTVNFPASTLSLGGISHTAGSVTFSGSSGSGLVMYGDFNIASTAIWNFLGTLGTGDPGVTLNFTTNGVTLNSKVGLSGNGTVALQSNVTLGSSYQFEVGVATLIMNGKTITCDSFKCIYGGTVDWGSSGSSAFYIKGTGTIWNTTNMVTLPSSASVSRSVYVQPSSSGTYTIDTGTTTDTTGLDWYFLSMPSGSTISFTNGNGARILQFDSASATCTVTNASFTISNSLRVNSSNFSFSSGTNAWTFTTGSGFGAVIKSSSGVVLDFPININGTRTWEIQGPVELGSTRAFTHTNGTVYFNTPNSLSVGSYVTASGTKALYIGAGATLTCKGSGNAFNNAAPTNFTFGGNTTGKISLTSASAKTFVGAGGTYDCIVSNDGAGALTISGSNTFTTLANGVQPTAFTFTSGTTTTVTNWNISGTAGNLVTIGSTSTSQHTLSKSSGTVNASYLSLSYSNATGGATWNATSTVNGGNNTGWIITSPSTGNFLAFFTQ